MQLFLVFTELRRSLLNHALESAWLSGQHGLAVALDDLVRHGEVGLAKLLDHERLELFGEVLDDIVDLGELLVLYLIIVLGVMLLAVSGTSGPDALGELVSGILLVLIVSFDGIFLFFVDLRHRCHFFGSLYRFTRLVLIDSGPGSTAFDIREMVRIVVELLTKRVLV